MEFLKHIVSLVTTFITQNLVTDLLLNDEALWQPKALFNIGIGGKWEMVIH